MLATVSPMTGPKYVEDDPWMTLRNNTSSLIPARAERNASCGIVQDANSGVRLPTSKRRIRASDCSDEPIIHQKSAHRGKVAAIPMKKSVKLQCRSENSGCRNAYASPAAMSSNAASMAHTIQKNPFNST